MSTPATGKAEETTSKTTVRRRKREILETEYLDLYYLSGFDVGQDIDPIDIAEQILNDHKGSEPVVAFALVPLSKMRDLERRGWKRIWSIGVWAKPYALIKGSMPSDIENHIRNRVINDALLHSYEYLGKTIFTRLFLGEIVFKIEEDALASKLSKLRGYVELLIHSNGVFVLTITIYIHDIPLSSKDVIRIRRLIETRKLLVIIPGHIYDAWLRIKIGREVPKRPRTTVTVKSSVYDVIEMYSIYIKRLVIEYIHGTALTSLNDLENRLRNPWDLTYAILFTEMLKGEKKALDMLTSYSTQLYTMMYGTGRVVSKRSLVRALRRSFYVVPLEPPETLIERKRPKTVRITTLATEASAHIITISRKYLGLTDIGYRIRLKHLTIFELIIHIKQTLRTLEHLTLRKPKDLDELVALKERFSKILDLVENSYFIIDRDARELFEHLTKIHEINRLVLRVERRLDALNYMIMTRYQDKINKMQMALTMLFGIFGVPFFIFSYTQWYFDYVVSGKSRSFWPVTIATFIPTALILLITILLYYKWKREIFSGTMKPSKKPLTSFQRHMQGT